jgi:ABC-type transporter Mla subunit MlaD
VQWADGVCSAVTDWKNTVLDVGTSLKGKPLTSSSLSDAGDQIRDATTTLAQTVKGLGAPDTTAGAAAQKSIDKLAKQLDSGAKAIEDAIAGASGVSGVLTATSTISSTLVTMGSEVSDTATELQQLDVKGELGKAFDEADSCKALRSS